MRRLTVALLALTVFAASPLRAAEKKNSKVTEALAYIHQDNLRAINTATLATENAGMNTVSTFARRVVKDRGEADQKTLEVARRLNVKLKTPGANDGKKGDRFIERLRQEKGVPFDRAYARIEGRQIRRAIDRLQFYQKRTAGTPVADHLAELLPVLQEHEKVIADLVPPMMKPVQ